MNLLILFGFLLRSLLFQLASGTPYDVWQQDNPTGDTNQYRLYKEKKRALKDVNYKFTYVFLIGLMWTGFSPLCIFLLIGLIIDESRTRNEFL